MKIKRIHLITLSIAIIAVASGSAFAIYQTDIFSADGNSSHAPLVKSSTSKTNVAASMPKIDDRKVQEAAAIPQPKSTDRYIEIDLSDQKLYGWNDGKVVNSFLISSGTYGRTPKGTFSIYSRSRSALMQGPGYYLPGVEWISRFTGPYSIHGTYWHSNFGHPMSHGCVNASNANAKWVYEWAPMGTPVVIHQ